MRSNREAGEGKLGTIVGLVLLAAVLYAAWNVGPVYFANYAFSDKMNEIARTPRRYGDQRIMDLLMKEAAERRINGYVTANHCRIETQEQYRRIFCEYEREVEVLPGWKHVIHFKNVADQPLI